MASKLFLATAASSAPRILWRHWLLAAWLIALPSLCRAANNCPWINEATASGLLGGDATGSFFQASRAQPALCVFVLNAAAGARTLRIAVEQTPDFVARIESAYKACGTDPDRLPAIGNEAYICNDDDGKKLFSERVVGRVRDQVFTITMGSTFKRDSILTREALKARVSVAAEQVSGNLF